MSTGETGDDVGTVETWRASMERLAEEWRTVVATDDRNERAHIDATVERWEQVIVTLHAEQDELLARGLWVGGPIDLMSVIGFARWETAHSAAVAWLLDPAMQHGLGTRFLEKLLAVCFPDDRFSALARAVVETEVPCSTGRIDILVRADDLTLVIENKVDAIEREHQCNDYYDCFGNEPGARFVFLSPSGRAPVTATGAAAEACRPLSYRRLADALAQALAETATGRLGKGRSAAEQYLLTLREELG
jgi:hypothetical protein